MLRSQWLPLQVLAVASVSQLPQCKVPAPAIGLKCLMFLRGSALLLHVTAMWLFALALALRTRVEIDEVFTMQKLRPVRRHLAPFGSCQKWRAALHTKGICREMLVEWLRQGGNLEEIAKEKAVPELWLHRLMMQS